MFGLFWGGVLFFSGGVPSAGVVYREESGGKAKLDLISGSSLTEEDPPIYFNFCMEKKQNMYIPAAISIFSS